MKANKDLGRFLLPEFVDIALESESVGTGETKQAIARQVLEKWARQRHLAFKVYGKRLRANGLQMELDGLEDDSGEGVRK